MKDNNKNDIIIEEDLNVINEEKAYKLKEFINEDRLLELKENLRKMFQNKFIIPLRKNTNKNIKRLYSSNYVNLPKESCNLLSQSCMTLKNVQKLVKSKNLVDSNTLIRSAFENLMMG